MRPMTYRVPALAKTPLLAILLLAMLAAIPQASRADGLSVKFVTEGTILPRRGHEVLTVESVDVAKLDASILHVSEADTLQALGHPETVPPSAQEVWHAQIDIKTDDKPGQPSKTAIDVLTLMKTLQPGLYICEVHEATTGKPRAIAHKIFAISNIGLEAFAGSDGLVVQARLLSEASPAVNIDIALIARNNREIARVRSDGDAVARFGKDQIAGLGEDAPAALYAYGADGEFTAMPISLPPIVPAAPASAYIVTDKSTYKPGEDIQGLALVRTPDGHQLQKKNLTVQLENSEGGIADFSSGINSDFTLRAPPAPYSGAWTIRAYIDDNNKPVPVGQLPIIVTSNEPTAPISAPKSEGLAVNDITISPGRRSFQRGQMADISVQPAHDAYVTIALVDRSVRAIVRQKITHEGAAIQLPVPTDAAGGLYVVATAFIPPLQANGAIPAQPLYRSYGMQWLDIDEGASRMSVRLDTPERAEIGGKLPIDITVPDLGGKTGTVQLVATDATQPATLDPLAHFYGRLPLQVRIMDTYGAVIGAPEAGVPDFAAESLSLAAPHALLWPKAQVTSNAGKTGFAETFPAMTGTDPRLRIAAIAWSEDKLGYGEATVIGVKPAKPVKTVVKVKPTLQPPRIRATILKPGETLILKPHEAIVSNIDPILAMPRGYEAAGGEPDGDHEVFVDSATPALHDFVLSLLGPQSDDEILGSAILALDLPDVSLALPQATTAKLLDAVQTMAAAPGVSNDHAMLAHYILLRAGRETVLEVRDWLQGNPGFTGMTARAARLSVAAQIPLKAEDASALLDKIDQQPGDLQTSALTLAILAQGNQPWPPHFAKTTSDEALKQQLSLGFRADLALRFAQGNRRFYGSPKIEVGGKPLLPEAQNNTAGALKIVNKDTRPLYAWIVSGLPK